ncbi:MAG: GtrA family protein [Bacteroidaceae bacterium]|nr:GtrA family protein [Bacteroidaceae bacterium]
MRIFKAFLTAQVASVVDFVVTVFLSSLLGVYYVIATAIGAFMGGVTNCILNYRWVFPVTSSKKLHIALKYLLVWGMSILLNTYGTYLLTEFLRDSDCVVTLLGTHADQVYIVSKVVVAILVAIGWNYQMQRLFVYR